MNILQDSVNWVSGIFVKGGPEFVAFAVLASLIIGAVIGPLITLLEEYDDGQL